MKGEGRSRRDKEMIRRKFSRAAERYDTYALIQKECASHLLQTLPAGFEPDTILEIGCGSGNYSRLLQEKYPDAVLTAIDFSEEMIRVARRNTGNARITFLTREGEEYLAATEEKFSLITSNATLQWFKDLPGAFANMAGRLEEDGLVQASVFGSESLASLGDALRNVVDQSLVLPSERFADRTALQECVSTCFDRFTIEERHFDWHFDSFLDLLRQIHNTGTGGFMEKPPHFTRRTIAELDRYLASRHPGQLRDGNLNGPVVSYQVYFLAASRPR